MRGGSLGRALSLDKLYLFGIECNFHLSTEDDNRDRDLNLCCLPVVIFHLADVSDDSLALPESAILYSDSVPDSEVDGQADTLLPFSDILLRFILFNDLSDLSLRHRLNLFVVSTSNEAGHLWD